MGRNRHCAACQRSLPRESFSKNQWSKPVGVSRCHACLHGYQQPPQRDMPPPLAPPPAKRPMTARRNDASRAEYQTYDLDNPFAQGTFRWVAKGTYTEGEREGQASVCKWFKTGSVFEEEFFQTDIKAVDKALHLVEEWNSQQFVDNLIRVNIPAVWTFDGDCSRTGQKILSEPYIENYQKFNSNSGWADDDTPWPRVMQALSHFSYHITGGQFVLCDLQGGVYSDGAVLTDPAVLSRSKSFGVTDLGPEGISTFFSQHRCNEFCRSSWDRPADQRQYLPVTQGTSMMKSQSIVPMRHSRPPMSHAYTGLAEVHDVHDGDADGAYWSS